MKKLIISIVLISLVLMQSCVIYHNTSVSIDEAYNKGRVKVNPNYGERILYKNIALRDSLYYGLNGGKETPLYPVQISSIQLQDIKKSKRATIITCIVVPAVIVGTLVLAVISIGNSTDDFNLDLSGAVWDF